MSEANEIVNPQITDAVTEENENTGHEIQGEVKPPSKWESSARAGGWVPLEEWQGDPEDWTDAKEFVKKGELCHKISGQSSEIKELKKAIGAFTEHHQKVKETEFNRALEYLKQQKKAALEEGDADKLLQADDAIDILKQERQQEAEKAKQQNQTGPTPFFQSWVQQNSWYLQDPELRSFADDIGVGAYQRVGGKIAEPELYALVRQRVMKAYPEKFRGQGSKTSSVEGAGSNSKPIKSDSFRLSEEEEKAMKTFVRQGIMTKEEYISEIKRVKGAA